jgi:hypothetical protein
MRSLNEQYLARFASHMLSAWYVRSTRGIQSCAAFSVQSRNRNYPAYCIGLE